METLDDIKRLIAFDYKRKTTKWSKEDMSCEVVLVGDSMVAYYQTQLKMCLQGIAGDTTAGVLKRVDLIKKTHASTVFLHVGTNDIVLESIQINQTIQHIQNIVHRLSPMHVIVISPLPVIETKISSLNQERTNRHLEMLTNKIIESFPENHLDLFHEFISQHEISSLYQEDGLHLNEHGYLIYESHLNAILKEIR